MQSVQHKGNPGSMDARGHTKSLPPRSMNMGPDNCEYDFWGVFEAYDTDTLALLRVRDHQIWQLLRPLAQASRTGVQRRDPYFCGT